MFAAKDQRRVVVRRIPRCVTESEFFEKVVEPFGDKVESSYFVQGRKHAYDTRLDRDGFGFVVLRSADDVYAFSVSVAALKFDEAGPAPASSSSSKITQRGPLVEYAPSQKAPPMPFCDKLQRCSRVVRTMVGSVEGSEHYEDFLAHLEKKSEEPKSGAGLGGGGVGSAASSFAAGAGAGAGAGAAASSTATATAPPAILQFVLQKRSRELAIALGAQHGHRNKGKAKAGAAKAGAAKASAAAKAERAKARANAEKKATQAAKRRAKKERRRREMADREKIAKHKEEQAKAKASIQIMKKDKT